MIGQTEWQNLLRQAKAQCDFLIAGVVADEVPIAQKGVTPVVPLAEPVEIVRNVRYVDLAFPAMTADKLEIWPARFGSTSFSKATTGAAPRR